MADMSDLLTKLLYDERLQALLAPGANWTQALPIARDYVKEAGGVGKLGLTLSEELVTSIEAYAQGGIQGPQGLAKLGVPILRAQLRDKGPQRLTPYQPGEGWGRLVRLLPLQGDELQRTVEAVLFEDAAGWNQQSYDAQRHVASAFADLLVARLLQGSPGQAPPAAYQAHGGRGALVLVLKALPRERVGEVLTQVFLAPVQQPPPAEAERAIIRQFGDMTFFALSIRRQQQQQQGSTPTKST